MSSIAKANISLSKKDLTKSRIPLVASRNVTFYHKTSGGELSIDLLALSMPSEMPTNVQATVAEISGANLSINKKNLSLVSSANGLLMSGLHYVVTSSTTIQLIGPYLISGAEVDEIFTGVINAAPISDLVVASARSVDKTYTLAVGQTILNLGREYQTGQNINDDIGSIKVFVNGVLAHRDTDYYEIDAGSGWGTTIGFYAAPVSLPYSVAVDFGVMSITDNDAIGTIENLAGAITKIADDLAVVAGTTASDYYSASPSEIERRTFGDMVLDHEINKADKSKLNSIYLETSSNGGEVIIGGVTDIPFIGVYDTSGAWNGSQYIVPEDGVYILSGNVFGTTTALRNIYLYIDGIQSVYLTDNSSVSVHKIGTVKRFTAGQVLSVRSTTGFTLSSTPVHHLTITKIPSNT